MQRPALSLRWSFYKLLTCFAAVTLFQQTPLAETAQRSEAGYLGAAFRDPADETIKALSLSSGTIIARVIPGGPAAGAGLLSGDMVLSIDDEPIAPGGQIPWGRITDPEGEQVKQNSVWNIERRYKPGETIKLGILRNGQSMTMSVTLIGASAGAALGTRFGGAGLVIPSEKRIAEFFPAARFPLEWAEAQNNIALAYTERPDGDKAENAEASIPYYEAALSIEAFKRRLAWDQAQINLGLAYQQRRQGSPEDNIERAIAAYTAVATVRPKSNLEWPRAQMLLGYAYAGRLVGDRNGNYYTAIAALEAALSVRSAYVDKAAVQDRRGDLYRMIEPAGSLQNIEKAIAAYKEVLGFRPDNKIQRQRWAKASEKLGDCYTQRKEGSGVENIMLAANAYQQALTIFTREAYPEDYARVQALKDEVQAKAKAEQAGKPL